MQLLHIILLIVVGALFLLFMYSFEKLFGAWLNRLQRKGRLSRRGKQAVHKQSFEPSVYTRLMRRMSIHLDQQLQALQFSMSGQQLLYMLISAFLMGGVLGWSFFATIKGMLLCAGMLAGVPYICLKMLLIHRRMGAQMDFLPAIELFYQCYLITGERQIKVALAKVIEEKRISGPMKSIFEQLYRNLCVQDNDEESLNIFAHALGHIWADYYVQMLKVALNEGVSITSSLKQLITDMRVARKANEQERHKLLEIRIANFTPLLFLFLFMGINFHFNRDQSVHYYFTDPVGREMILNMLLMIFLSFLMGLYLSRKKMT